MQDKSFNDITEMLKKHYKPHRLVGSERFRFRNARQEAGYSITQYATHLKKLVSTCEFTGDMLEQNLKDQFVQGLKSKSIQEKLIGKTCSFNDAVEAALAEEMAVKDVQEIAGGNQATVNKISQPGQGRGRTRRNGYAGKRHGRESATGAGSSRPKRRCDRCGLSNHSRDECKYKTFTCYNCNKVGHLKSECRAARSSSSGQNSRGSQPPKKGDDCRYITTDVSEDEDEDDFSDATFMVNENDKVKHDNDSVKYASTKPVFIPVHANGIK